MTESAKKRPRLTDSRRKTHIVLGCLIVGWLGALALPLIAWGLPSPQLNSLLFGDGPVWQSEDYRASEAVKTLRNREAGADVDVNPLTNRDKLVNLTASHADRAEILTRYRLYSRQPDEMVTFRALQQMNPRGGDFDPKMYQYGGAYVFLVGSVLATCHVLGWVTLTSDINTYLQQPELFGQFYVAARSLSVAFGVVLLLGIYRLARHACDRFAGLAAVALVALSPIFTTTTLEAKPHLASAAMAIWGSYFALRYLRSRKRRDAVLLGITTGLAAGFVLTGLAAIFTCLLTFAAASLLPKTNIAAKTSRQFAWAGGSFAVVFSITNIFLIKNLIVNRDLVFNNIGNTAEMFPAMNILSGFRTATLLLSESISFVGLIVAIGMFFWLLKQRPWHLLTVAGVGIVIMAVCVITGANKPAEFARFLVVPSVLLLVGAGIFFGKTSQRHPILTLVAFVITLIAVNKPAYLTNFGIDKDLKNESRFLAGSWLEKNVPADTSVGVSREPAPYCAPPMNFAERTVVLLPKVKPDNFNSDDLPDWLVLTADDETQYANSWWINDYELANSFAADRFSLSRISWANKPTFIYRRKSMDHSRQ